MKFSDYSLTWKIFAFSRIFFLAVAALLIIKKNPKLKLHNIITIIITVKMYIPLMKIMTALSLNSNKTNKILYFS